MYAAYDALSDRMKVCLQGLTATHDGGKAFKRFNPDGTYPVSVHPVIRVHPATGRKLIYVNRGFTSHINELPPEESAAVLAFLYTHCERPEWQVRFRWRRNSVAFWDNRCTQHLAVWDYFPQKRSGIRGCRSTASRFWRPDSAPETSAGSARLGAAPPVQDLPAVAIQTLSWPLMWARARSRCLAR